MDFKNKTALITGGARGIGRAIVNYFAANGANVVFTDRPADQVAVEFEKELLGKGYLVKLFEADAASFLQAENCVNFVLENFQRLDILVNNVGITKDTLLMRMSEKDFDDVIDVNLKSVFNYTKSAVKPMITQRSGRIISIASIVGIIGNPGQANYVASKAGIIGFTKSVAKEVASRNITVNAIAPGFIASDMTDKLSDKQKEALLAVIPMKRMGIPDYIAKCAGFLASDDAEYITGQIITVDGGMVM